MSRMVELGRGDLRIYFRLCGGALITDGFVGLMLLDPSSQPHRDKLNRRITMGPCLRSAGAGQESLKVPPAPKRCVVLTSISPSTFSIWYQCF